MILLQDNEHEARIEASLALYKMAPASRLAVPALAEALDDRAADVRMYATMALHRLGAEARPALPGLIKALANRNNQAATSRFALTIQEAMILALGKISAGTDEAVPALMETLKASKTADIRLATVQALDDIGAPARPAIPLLRSLLGHPDQDVRQAARDILKKLGNAKSAASLSPRSKQGVGEVVGGNSGLGRARQQERTGENRGNRERLVSVVSVASCSMG